MRLVLDTNVVIDWLVFGDVSLAPFREQVQSRSIELITHDPALEELRRVLAYPAFELDAHRQAAVLEQYAALASFFRNDPTSAVELPAGFPRCRDPDDNPFLELAWRARADALVSRDKKVLKLRRRARRFGFGIYDVPGITSLPALAGSART